jgi:glycosyltransferase involved in cell wall biosynthesis
MKFSIIIPTYNRVDFLQKAITSVTQQTYQNYEIIVVNDNPGDKDSINALAATLDKIKVIHHAETKGGNAARNSGILNSTGELIAFLDDDDLWLPGKLSMHLEEHKKNDNTGLVYSDCLYVFNNSFIKNYVSSTRLPHNIIEAMGKAEFCPPTSSMVTITRECVNKCGLFDETLASLQDWDYWFRIGHFFDFSHLPEVLVHFNQHLGDRTSQNEMRRREGLRQITDKWENEINISVFRQNLIRSIYYKNSRNALMAGNKMTAFKNSFKLLKREVLNITSFRNFVKIILDIIFKKNKRLTEY